MPPWGTSIVTQMKGMNKMKRIAVLAVVISAAAIAGCSTSASTSSSTTTTQASAATSSTVANSLTGTVKWVTNNKAVVAALSSDVSTLATALPGAVSSRNPSAVTASCQELAADISKAKTLPPIPNSTAQKAWTTLLNELSAASQKCSEGIAKNDTGELSQAASEVTGSSNTLKSLTSTLGL